MQVDPSSGEVSLSRPVSLNSSDLSGIDTYEAVFLASDGGTECLPDPVGDPDACQGNATVVLRIRDVNDHAPIVTLNSANTVTVAENSAVVFDFDIVVDDEDSDVAFSTYYFDIV